MPDHEGDDCLVAEAVHDRKAAQISSRRSSLPIRGTFLPFRQTPRATASGPRARGRRRKIAPATCPTAAGDVERSRGGCF